jgi:hypothetical protein
MAVFFDMPGCERDDYEFRGPVKSVKAAPEVLRQQGWIARVTVIRCGERDADLDILITRRAWKGDEPPEAGQDIEGTLWLQGRLWSSQEWERRAADDSYGGTMDKEQQQREKIIEDLMKYSGMSRQDAEFAADVELGILPGDVFVVDDDSVD